MKYIQYKPKSSETPVVYKIVPLTEELYEAAMKWDLYVASIAVDGAAKFSPSMSDDDEIDLGLFPSVLSRNKIPLPEVTLDLLIKDKEIMHQAGLLQKRLSKPPILENILNRFEKGVDETTLVAFVIEKKTFEETPNLNSKLQAYFVTPRIRSFKKDLIKELAFSA